VPGKAVGRAAVDLPWLCPNTDSLVRLAETPASLAVSSSVDPALFTFLVRFALGEAGSPFVQPNDRLVSATLPEVAAAYLANTTHGWLNPDSLTVEWINVVANRAAAIARELAERTSRVHPEAAETAARLVPLGWYAVLAVDEAEAEACFQHPDEQAARWGLDHDAIARRIAARWRLPEWLANLIGHLNQPWNAVAELGADLDLFAIVSLAVRIAEEQTANLGLTQRADIERCTLHLGGTFELVGKVAEAASPRYSGLNQNPHGVPLVANLLRSAAQSRRRNGASLVIRLEERIDELHRTVESLADQAATRVHDAKLISLAEFAAGAGHEINNPLAVISGNAQRLLRTEQDDDRADSLRAIVRQSQRISGILRDLMQFARPPKVEAENVLAINAAAEAYREMLPLAEERGVRLELVPSAADAKLHADPRQVKAALLAVIRNGIEAAGTGGWVRIESIRHFESIRFCIEDSGPGLAPRDADHAFDPFYCGRAAGRGRGLGLPTAWQLARRNSGELRHEPTPEGPTRFVLSFPLATRDSAERRSA
jgi:two-component system NtrC family sensor kinase